ncbi:MAG: hypothetical protein FJ404_10805 [Verrucomicrobia bacterium]|nr:hypothetical protein [Verrucomicrobiota bacterium]
MDWLWFDGKFLGIEWHPWKVLGWVGNAVFSARFFVQWYATERKGRVVVPQAFWWLSLIGSLCLLAYALVYQRDSVFIFAYGFTWIPYIRNLIIHRRTKGGGHCCGRCGFLAEDRAKFCSDCGARLGCGEERQGSGSEQR